MSDQRISWRKKSALTALIAGIFSGLSAPAIAATLTWADVGSDWATNANWGGTAPADSLTMDIAQFNSATYSFQPTLAAVRSINGIIIGAASGAPVTITTPTTGIGLSIGAAGIDMSAAGSDLTLGGAANNIFTIGAAQNWTVASGRTLTANGILALTNRLTLNGAGTVTLAGANTGTGGVTLASGTLNVNHATALGAAGGQFIITGGTLSNSTAGTVTMTANNAQAWNGDFTYNSAQALSMGTGAVTMNAARQITVSGAGGLTVGGAITGATFGITKSGSGSLTLNGVIGTTTGGLAVTGGTLVVGGAANTFTGNLTVDGASSALQMSSGSNGNATSGPLGIVTGGTAYKTLTLSNGGIFRPMTTFNNNTPTAALPGNGFVISIASTGGVIDTPTGVTLTIDDGTGNGTATTASQLQGTGTLTKTGVGTLSLGNTTSSNAVFTGQIVVTNGVLRLGALSAAGVGLGATSANTVIQSGATFDINNNASTAAEPVTISGTGFGGINVIRTSNAAAGSFAGPITLAADSTIGSGAAGTMTLSGAFGGAFNLTTKNMAAGGTTLSGAQNITGSITNNGTGAGLTTISGVIASTITGITQNSTTSGLALSGNNASYANGVSILAGTVTTSGSANALGTGTVLLGDTTGSAAATLSTGATALTFANQITVQAGSSGVKTMALTGANNVTNSGAITLNGNLTFNSSSSARWTLSGLIGGAGSVTYQGSSSGDFNPTQQNTYTGGTTLSAGGVIPVSGSSIGPAGAPTSGLFGTGTLTLNGGSLRSGTGGPFTIGNTLTLAADSSFITIAGEKSLVFSGPMTMTGGTRTLTSAVGTTVAGTTVQFDGVVSDGGSGFGLTKAGAGNVTFTNANTYTGATTVNGGQLILTSTASLANPTITAQTGGNITFSGNSTIGGTTTPVINLVGNATPATSGGLSLADGGVNTLTINSATPATPALIIGGAASNPANLTFDAGATSDQLVFGAGVQATVNAGGALVNVVGLGDFNGTTQTLISSPTTDLTAGGAFVLGTVTGNTNNMLLSLNTTTNAVQLLQTANLGAAPADAYFKGNLSASWTHTAGANAANNFTTDAAGTTAATQLPDATTKVHFYATGATTANLATTLNQNFTIDSLISEATATTAASIASGTPAGALTLTPASSANGITLNAGAGALTISAPLVLGADQTWTSATQTLTVSGGISGANDLALNTATGTFAITGANAATSLTFTPSGAGILTVTDTTVTGPSGDFNVGSNGLGVGTVTLNGGTLNLRANGDGTTAAQTITYNNALVITAPVTINADYFSAAGGNGKILAFATTSVGGVTVTATGASHGYSVGLGDVTLNSAASSTTTLAPATTVFQRANNVTGSATAGNTNTLVLGGTIASAGSTISGVISDGSGGGQVALTTNTVGIWSLTGSASNTYTGPTLVSKTGTAGGLTLAKTGGAIAIPGDLTIGDATALQAHVIMGGDNQIAPTSNVVFNGVNSGWAYFQLRGNDQTFNNISETSAGFGVIETREAAGTFGTSLLTLNVATGTQAYRGYFRDISSGTDATNSIGLVKTGAGILQWGAASNGTGSAGTSATAHNYSGGTNIQNGTLQLVASGSASPISIVGPGNVTLDGGATFAGTLDLNGLTTGITGLNGTSGAVLGRVVNNLTATNAVLTIGNANNSGSFAGVIADNDTGTGTVGITKIGTGTQALTGTNTYTGTTTISAGTLALQGNGSIANNSVNLGAGTFSILKDGAGNNGTIAQGTNVNITATGGTINVDNNGTNTGNTVVFGAFNSPAGATATTTNFTGADGYNMSFSNLTLNGATGQTTTLNPTTTLVTIVGNVTNPMSGFATGNFDTLALSGTSGTNAAPNVINGNIMDAPTGAFTPTLLGGYTRVLKSGTGVWQLNGTASNYTGATIVNAGTLQAGANNVIPLTNLQGIANTATGAGVTSTYDLNGFDQTLNTVNGTGTALTLGGSTATSTANIAGAGSTLTIEGGVTYTATNNPLMSTISVTNLNLGAANQTFNVGDSTSAPIDLTVSSSLSNGSLTKTGAGVLNLTGNVNLTSLFATAGTLGITGTTNLNSTAITVNGGIFDLGGTSQAASLFTLSSGTIINGSLTGSATYLRQGPGTTTLGVAYNTGAATAVTINQGLLSTTSNPATTSTLALNFNAVNAPTTFFDTGSTLTLGGPANNVTGGGQLNALGINNGTSTQNFTSTLIDGGASSIVATIGTTGTVNLGLGTLSRNVGGTLDITLPATGVVTQGTPGAAGTLLRSVSGTAYGTVGGNDWAANDTDTAGKIVGLSTAGAGATSLYTTSSSAATFTGNANITGSFTATTGSTVNSIRFNTGTSLALTLAGTNTVTTGGILVGSGITTGATITGGTLVPGAGQELVFINNKAGATLAISSVLADNGVNPTTVTYRGNPAGATTGSIFGVTVNNTYTGPTYITNGRLQSTTAGITTPVGTGANAIVYVDGNQDGQFYLSTNVTVANPFVIIGNGFNENGTRRGAIRLDSASANTPTLSGPITLVGDARIYNNAAITGAGTAVISGNIGTSNVQGATSFALTKDGTGQIRLTGTNSQTATNINGGWLTINAEAALGLANAPVTFNASSTLQFQTGMTLGASRNIVLAAGTATIDTNPNNTNIGSSEIKGVISGPGALFKNFTTANNTLANNVTLSGVNTFTGNVTIQGGWLTATNSSSLGTGTKTVTINNNTSWAPQFHLDPAAGSTPLVGIDLPATMSFTVSANGNAFVNDSGDNIIRGAITINSGGGGLTASANAGKLTFAGNIAPNTTGRAITVRGNATGEISGIIANGGTVDMPISRDTGTGTWILSGANTYTGSTTATLGTFKLGNAAALGGINTTGLNVDNGTLVASGGALDLGGQNNILENIRIIGTGVGGTGALTNTGAAASIGQASLSGISGIRTTSSAGVTITSGNALSFTGGGGTGAAGTFNAGITAASLSFNAGTTLYSAAPTAAISGGTGATATIAIGGVANGTFTITPGTQTYSVAPTVTITGTGTGATAVAVLDINGAITGINVTAAGTGYTGTPTITFAGGTVLAAGTATTGVGSTKFLATGITITAAGTNFTGTPMVTISGGTVATAGTNPTVTGNNTNFVLQGITITNSGTGYTSAPVASLPAGSTPVLTTTLAGVQMTGNSSIGGTGDITLNGPLSESAAGLVMTKIGTNALSLNNVNTYTGGTILSTGTLNLNNASAIGTGALTIQGGTIDNTSAAAITLATNNVQSWSGDFAFTGTQDLNLGTGAVTLSGAGTARQVTTTGGNLTIGGAIGGSGFGLTKAGAGTLTLNAVNTYNGITTINAGTLIVASNLGLANNGPAQVLMAAPDSTIAGNPLLTRAIAAGVNTYAGFGSQVTAASLDPVLLTSSLQTSAEILMSGDNVAANNMSMQWRTRTTAEAAGSNSNAVLSDVVNITGMGNDVFVLQMSYDPAALAALSLNENSIALSGELRLGWNNAGTWTTATDGNTAGPGSGTFVGMTDWNSYYTGISSVDDGSDLALFLGKYGVDPTTNKVWAVVDHNSEFAVIPEPSTLVFGGLALLGFAGVGLRRRRLTQQQS